MAATMTALYGGGPLYDPTDEVIEDIINSKYSTYVFWTLHITSTGDITHNGGPLITAGTYVGASSWVTQLVKLKNAGVRVLFSIGSWPYPGPSVQPYTPWIFYQINHFLPTKQVTVEGDTFDVYTIPSSTDGNVLYDNFNVLREAFRYTDSDGKTQYALDGVNFDNEDYYSSSLMATFSRMLYTIGYEQVTFCPYNNMSVWIEALDYIANGNSTPIKGKTPTYASGNTPSSWTTKGLDTYRNGLDGFVTELQLQCYDGGLGNFPKEWIDAIEALNLITPVPVYPGYMVNSQQGATPSCNSESIVCPHNFEKAFHYLASGYNSYGVGPNGSSETPTPVSLSGGFVWYYDQVLHCQNTPLSSSGCSETPNAQNYRTALLQGIGHSTNQ